MSTPVEYGTLYLFMWMGMKGHVGVETNVVGLTRGCEKYRSEDMFTVMLQSPCI